MSYKGLPDSLVARIDPRDARGYASSAGWVRVHGINGSVVVYNHPQSDLDQLLIPLDVAAPDYARRMAEVVVNLADREHRLAKEVLNDLLTPPADVLRFTLADPETEAGSLPLNRGIDLVLGAKRAILASACSVIQPQSFHPRLSRTEAEALVEASRLGQTERGSFTVTVACPLNAIGPPRQAAPMPLFPDEAAAEAEDTPNYPVSPPFTREVTVLLMRSSARIVAAVDADDLGSLTKPAQEDIPLSANLCEALLLMQPNGDRSRLTISAGWSRSIPRPEPQIPAVVQLRREYFSAIEELSQSLRPVREPKLSQFIGLVDALLGDPYTDGQVRGDVQLLIMNQDEVARARVTLNAGDYHLAWEAHGYGGYVSLHGVLRSGGRLHRIEHVHDFRVLGSPTSLED